MKRIATDWCLIKINKTSKLPIWRQIYAEIRTLIVVRKLMHGLSLPSTRQLAQQLGVSRNTVISAYEQLHAEGYIISKTGSGFQVSTKVDLTISKSNPVNQTFNIPTSQRAIAIIDTQSSSLLRFTKPQPFRLGTPAFDLFPFTTWHKLINKQLKLIHSELVMYSNTQGYPKLRVAIASYIRDNRGVACTPEQIVIFSGAQQALSVLSKIVADQNDCVWIENPGYLAAQRAFLDSALKLVPCSVDKEGITIRHNRPIPRIIYTTPSHQYPLGTTMSAARRIELLEFAKKSKCWIFEDDYNSEFRYSGQPILSLQGLQHANNVIYIGTFSKIMFPALRVGFAVVPQNLITSSVYLRSLQGVHSCSVEHAALAEFITQGFLARHVRKMRLIYSERKQALENYLKTHLHNNYEIIPSYAGMHTVIRSMRKVDDLKITDQAKQNGIEITALSRYFLKDKKEAGYLMYGWLLGFSGFSYKRLIEEAEKLVKLLNKY